jgi:hypothetical protein
MPWTNVLTNEDIAFAKKLQKRARERKWYADNAEAEKARRITYRSNNPEKVKAAYKKWYEANPEKARKATNDWLANNNGKNKNRTYNIKSKYGLTNEQWTDLFVRQACCCAICGVHETKVWHTDHCHKTNKVRGILCASCNPGLGRFKDSIEIMKAAIAYLERIK